MTGTPRPGSLGADARSGEDGRPLRDPPRAGARRHGHGPPRAPARPGPARRAEGARSLPRGRPLVRAAVRARVARGRFAQPPEHRDRARLLRARRDAVHRDGVRRGGLAAAVGGADDAGPAHRRAGGHPGRPDLRRGAGDRAPRPQARERHGELARAGQDRRLRDREGDDEPPDRRVPDRDRGHRGDTELHGPGAGDGAAGRALDRPLLGRLHGLRAVHRTRPVPRRRRADGDPHAPRQRADPARARDRPVDRRGDL